VNKLGRNAENSHPSAAADPAPTILPNSPELPLGGEREQQVEKEEQDHLDMNYLDRDLLGEDSEVTQ